MEADEGNTGAKDALEDLKMKYCDTRGLASSAQTTTTQTDKKAQSVVSAGDNVNYKKDEDTNSLTNNPQSVFNDQHVFDGLKEKYVHERS